MFVFPFFIDLMVFDKGIKERLPYGRCTNIFRTDINDFQAHGSTVLPVFGGLLSVNHFRYDLEMISLPLV